ncbi:TetR/AcrR family transcriptional regulator [Spirosoma koreense]
METKKKRNRNQTQQRILIALQAVIAQHGLEGATISLVADQAQVSKVLIYRYFGSLDGLLEEYIQNGLLFPLPPQGDSLIALQEGEMAQFWTSQTRLLFRQLRSSKATREMLKAALTGDDEASILLSQTQDAQLNRFVDQLHLEGDLAGDDTSAMLSIILGGLSYLTIMAHQDRPMLGIDLRSEAGWQRVETALKILYRHLDKSRTHRRTNSHTSELARMALSMW